MAESSGWNNRSAASQRSGFMSSMAHARAYDHGATLPVHSNSEYSHMGFYSRRMQNGETFSGGHSRSRSMQAVNTPESANGAALVIDIHRQYGRILSPTNVRRPNLHIFFSLQTLNGTEPLSAITDDLSELFEVGDQ
ncbi:unnamed protein product, partial [Anisakis simplex]|uniref:PKP3 n=1 Tax=Anisakis simplex TaxID=6269 RepID=A0A0M3K6W6_ANISI